MQAVVLGNKSFLPRSRGDFATALQLLDQAKRLVPTIDRAVVDHGARSATEAGRTKPSEAWSSRAAEGIPDDANAGEGRLVDYYDRPGWLLQRPGAHPLGPADADHAVLEECIGRWPDAARSACYLADQPRLGGRGRGDRPASSEPSFV